jgi:hypothetical protein
MNFGSLIKGARRICSIFVLNGREVNSYGAGVAVADPRC